MLGGPILETRLHQAHSINIGRDVFRLTGKVRSATKSLKGRLAVAQPPGATMAVRENKLACGALKVKAEPHIIAENRSRPVETGKYASGRA